MRAGRVRAVLELRPQPHKASRPATLVRALTYYRTVE
jgi:hypothetical protein